MTPHREREDGDATPANPPAAVLSRPPCPLETLRKRRDFLAAARAGRQVTAGFILQARRRGPHEPPAPLIRVGFTASKKVGNAVARNRAKRRLRALAREILPTHATPGRDYVLIARAGETATRPFADLARDLTLALAKIHRPPRRKPVRG